MFILSSVYFFFSPFFISNRDLRFGIGGFLAGLVIPHDNGYTISIVEKLEDLVIIILLPLVCACLSKET